MGTGWICPTTANNPMLYPVHKNDFRVRDPFIVCENGKYYLVHSNGRGVSVRVSEDLEYFSEPVPVFTPPENFWADRDFWAPEIHRYKGKWYLFLSLKSESRCRATQIFVSDPFCPEEGMNFVPLSDAPATPADWECLDGTLYEENGIPYMVFCHEWLQVGDGEICAVPLKEDLSAPAGDPKLLFRASEAAWALPAWHSDRNGRDDNLVTDGPFLYKMESGALAMLWSSGGFPAPGSSRRYVLAAAISDSGSLLGPWRQNHPLLFTEDGGHGMIFTDLGGRKCLCLHAPNSENEHLTLFVLQEKDGVLSLTQS